MAKACAQRNRLLYLRGWDAALERVCETLSEFADEQLSPDQRALRQAIFHMLQPLFPDEDSLRMKLTNSQLAHKYAVSPRTVTNWRREDCPFEDGQWAVLDWVSERRIIPAGVKAKFAKQLKKRLENQELDEFAALGSAAKELLRSVQQFRG